MCIDTHVLTGVPHKVCMCKDETLPMFMFLLSEQAHTHTHTHTQGVVVGVVGGGRGAPPSPSPLSSISWKALHGCWGLPDGGKGERVGDGLHVAQDYGQITCPLLCHCQPTAHATARDEALCLWHCMRHCMWHCLWHCQATPGVEDIPCGPAYGTAGMRPLPVALPVPLPGHC